jgi:hypothetical protein
MAEHQCCGKVHLLDQIAEGGGIICAGRAAVVVWRAHFQRPDEYGKPGEDYAATPILIRSGLEETL